MKIQIIFIFLMVPSIWSFEYCLIQIKEGNCSLMGVSETYPNQNVSIF